MRIIKSIQNKIYEIRGERVMLDFDLAILYEVSTKALNQAVKRNLKRFPKDFMFRLEISEWESMWSQFVTTYDDKELQPVKTYQERRRKDNMPYAFTEQGVAMLSGILSSDKAIAMNIAIMRAFVEIRKVLIRESDISDQLKQIKERIGEHDVQLNQFYEAMENLLDENASKKKWEERERIGFKKQ